MTTLREPGFQAHWQGIQIISQVMPNLYAVIAVIARVLRSVRCSCSCAATQNKKLTGNYLSQNLHRLLAIGLERDHRSLAPTKITFTTSSPPTGLKSHTHLLTDDVTCCPLILRDKFVSVRPFPSHCMGPRETHLGKTRGWAVSSLTKMCLQAAVPGFQLPFLILQRKNSCHVSNAFLFACYKKGCWKWSQWDLLMVFVQHDSSTHLNVTVFCP